MRVRNWLAKLCRSFQFNFGRRIRKRRLAIGRKQNQFKRIRRAVSTATAAAAMMASSAASADDMFLTDMRSSIPDQRQEYLVTADFDGDGILDAAISGRSPNAVTIMLGTASGVFVEGQTIGNFDYGALSLADVNGDGIDDLLRMNSFCFLIDVLVGQGDGTFVMTDEISIPGLDFMAYANEFTVADFNGDGFDDVVSTTGRFLPYSNDTHGSVFITLGNGDGTFSPTQAITGFNIIATRVEAGDFNGDGFMDFSMFAGGNHVLLGNGDGTFQDIIDSGILGGTIAVGDFNGDGLDDAINSQVTVWLSNGDGTFQIGQDLDFPHFVLGLAIDDLNGDGILDFVNGGIEVGIGNGDGTFSMTGQPLEVDGNLVAIGDFTQLLCPTFLI